MRIALVIFIALMLAGCTLLSLQMGAIAVPWRALLTDWQPGCEHYYVLMEYRLPRVLLALFVGAALAVAGVLVQGIVRNPLASPDILGINHAASLASVGGLLLIPSLPVIVLPLLAFIGGMTGLLILNLLANTRQPMKLALTGVALSACWASLTDYLMLLHPQDVNGADREPVGARLDLCENCRAAARAVPAAEPVLLPRSRSAGAGRCAGGHAWRVSFPAPVLGVIAGRRHDRNRRGGLRPD